ncbi:MAG: aminotransferase class III-fold pyridoxal phosphate-dependent enzyme, partial [Oscillospiraceae bacterium]|nr:aminotransferase class III-fold pyridoxal phosphate-dependent enzyme [Oscillospiraceae bacterium]
VSMAKGLGGGLPIGGVLFGERTHGVLTPGTHATTFGGNPVVCAGGCQIVKAITAPGFLEEVVKKGEYIRKALAVMPGVEGVDGMGLMLGVRLKEGIAAADVVKTAMAEGVLVLTAKTKVRMLPPLNITYDELDRGLAALGRALAQFA